MVKIIFLKQRLFFLHAKKKRHDHMMRTHSERCCAYRTAEDNERLKNARKQIREIKRKPMMLWRLFREALLSGGACRDIVEKHVMCKLNGTELKFFYDVNTETRKLVKRSSRAGDLKKKFKIEEMSSISTLEVRSRINRCGRVTCTTKDLLSAIKLLERINSSCSSGCEIESTSSRENE